MAQRATSLGPQPALFFVFFVFCFCLEGVRVRWGGQRATSLGPKPSVFVFFAFPSLLLIENLFSLKNVMGNHELSPLDAICVAPVYTAAWAQEHASSETCLMASSYRKSVHYSGWFVGSIFHAVACCLDSVHYPLRIWLWSGLLRYNKKGHVCCSFFCVSLCFSLAFLVSPFFTFSLCVSLWFLAFFHLFLFFCLLSCFALNHNLRFVFALHLVFLMLLFFVFVAFIFSYFLIFGYLSKKHLWKNENSKNTKNEKCRKKTDTLTRAVGTVVFTNSVLFSFLCFFKFRIFAEHTINKGGSAKTKTKRNKK